MYAWFPVSNEVLLNKLKGGVILSTTLTIQGVENVYNHYFVFWKARVKILDLVFWQTMALPTFWISIWLNIIRIVLLSLVF